MAARYLEIRKTAGDDLEAFQVSIADADGNAYDLTGLTPGYQYRDAAGAWQSVPVAVSGDPTAGVVAIDWPGNIPAGVWQHRLTVTDGTDLQTLVYGELVVRAVA